MLISRRRALLHGLSLISGSAVVPAYLARTAVASSRQASRDRIVIAILLTGGPDGLSLVPPYCHDDYYRIRKATGVPARSVIKLNDEVGLHPRLTGFKQLLDQGAMATILGTGYPNFNLSHFESRDFWEAANDKDQSGKAGATGWLGRYLDYACGEVKDPTLNVAVGPAACRSSSPARGIPALAWRRRTRSGFLARRVPRASPPTAGSISLPVRPAPRTSSSSSRRR